MSEQKVNRVSGKIVLFLSIMALVTVLFGYTLPRGMVETDEGTGAHIFQLSIVALAPAVLVFLVTADWKNPRQSTRPLVFSAIAVVLAFGALYYLEHYWFSPR